MKLISKIIKKCISIITIILALTLLLSYMAYRVFFPYKYEQYINDYSKIYNVDPLLVLSVIKAESKFDEKALSYKGAYGLMQITQATAEEIAEELAIENYNVEMLYNPKVNIRMGTYYISFLIDRLGDTETALAAYNAGIGNVRKWLANEEYSTNGLTLDHIPFVETNNYVKNIRISYKAYKFLYRELPRHIPVKF